MTRSGILISLIILAMIWAIVNSIIPRGTDPRRHSLGQLAETDMGSIKLPFGWQVSRRETHADRILLDFNGRYPRAPRIRIESKSQSLTEPKPSEMERRRFLKFNTVGKTYFDNSRRMAWSESRITDFDNEKHVIVAHLYQPRNIRIRFVDEDTTPSFVSTVEKIVESYSFDVADASPKEPLLADAIPKKPPFTLADDDRKAQARWAMGALALFLGLLLIERRMERKLVEADIADAKQRRHDALAARLAAQGTPFNSLDDASDSMPDEMQPLDEVSDSSSQKPAPSRSVPVDESDVQALLRESDAAAEAKRAKSDNAPIPFDD